MAEDPQPYPDRAGTVDNIHGFERARLPRISVTLDSATARTLAEDAAARMIPVAEAVRQAIAFDIAARDRATSALVNAMAERGAAAQRLAQILANPTTDRMGRRLDAMGRASRHARAVRKTEGKSEA